MSKDDPYAPAAWMGEKVVQDRNLTKLPIDPFAIAAELGIEVKAKPVSAAGVSGMLIRLDNLYGIVYATHIDNSGFQRFCVAHELGHYFLSGHPEAIFDARGIHESRAGFASGDKYELEADHFAAGLLMPSHLFTPAMVRAGSGLKGIERLANMCETSLISTAIRYAQCTRDPMAIVVSTGNQVDYAFMSSALKDFDGIDWIRKRQAVPRNTQTFTFNQDASRVRAADRVESTCEFQDWFGGRKSMEIDEDVIGLGSYGKTLTILYGITSPEDDEEDEEALEESYKPRFRR